MVQQLLTKMLLLKKMCMKFWNICLHLHDMGTPIPGAHIIETAVATPLDSSNKSRLMYFYF